MLKSTFCHLPGIGIETERRLWRKGVLTWEDLEGFLGKRKEAWEGLTRSFSRLDAEDPAYFAGLLPQSLHWRIFPEFRKSTAYIDIETNGYMGPAGYVTAITLYDGERVRTYTRGINLDEFGEDIRPYKLLVTYNGKCFDIPFIENDLGLRLPRAHIDLRHVLRSLGFSGGLKGCEKALGFERGELSGLDGYFAVLLWNDYLKTGSSRTLETLLAYNIMDTVNLENLLICAYNLKLRETPFGAKHISMSPPPDAPFSADGGTIRRILRENPWYAHRARALCKSASAGPGAPTGFKPI